MDVIDNEEVFEANTHESETINSNSLKTVCLMVRFSIIASIIKLQSFNYSFIYKANGYYIF